VTEDWKATVLVLHTSSSDDLLTKATGKVQDVGLKGFCLKDVRWHGDGSQVSQESPVSVVLHLPGRSTLFGYGILAWFDNSVPGRLGIHIRNFDDPTSQERWQQIVRELLSA